MSEYPNKFNFKKSFPLIALAGLGFGLSLSAVDPIKIRDRLRAEYRAIFDNLLTNSNEKPDVDLALENLPEGTEPVIAQWMNDSMEGNRRKISHGRVRPHHVLADVLEAALSVAGRRDHK